MAVPAVIGEVIGVDFADGTVISVRVPDGSRWAKYPVEIRVIDRMSEAELLASLEALSNPPMSENGDG